VETRELGGGRGWWSGRREGLCGDGARSIASGRLANRTQRFEERDKSGSFRGTEILAVGGHVATALDDLANELVLGKEEGDLIEGGTPLAALVTESMAVMALLKLKDESPLPLECRTILEELWGNGIAAPGVHDRTPGSMTGKIGEGAEHDGDEKNSENGDGTTAPTFFAFTENKRQEQECKNGDHRTDEESGRLHVRRQ